MKNNKSSFSGFADGYVPPEGLSQEDPKPPIVSRRNFLKGFGVLAAGLLAKGVAKHLPHEAVVPEGHEEQEPLRLSHDEMKLCESVFKRAKIFDHQNPGEGVTSVSVWGGFDDGFYVSATGCVVLFHQTGKILIGAIMKYFTHTETGRQIMSITRGELTLTSMWGGRKSGNMERIDLAGQPGGIDIDVETGQQILKSTYTYDKEHMRAYKEFITSFLADIKKIDEFLS